MAMFLDFMDRLQFFLKLLQPKRNSLVITLQCLMTVLLKS